MDGYWQCVESVLGSTNTVFTGEFDVGEVIEIRQGQLIGLASAGESWLRADLELMLGFLVNWYSNRADGRTVDYHVGWDRLSTGAGAFIDYVNYGLRLAANGPNELIGFESAIEQENSQVSRTQWTAGVRFNRMSSFPAYLGTATEQAGPKASSRFVKPTK